jgi:hypothetical protein
MAGGLDIIVAQDLKYDGIQFTQIVTYLEGDDLYASFDLTTEEPRENDEWLWLAGNTLRVVKDTYDERIDYEIQPVHIGASNKILYTLNYSYRERPLIHLALPSKFVVNAKSLEENMPDYMVYNRGRLCLGWNCKVNELRFSFELLQCATQGEFDNKVELLRRWWYEKIDGPSLKNSNGTGEGRLVISLHGIRTRGAWQKELTAALHKHGFEYEPYDYNFFRAIQLVLPFMRDSQVKKFRDWCYAHTKRESKLPSVIAHSFGTYLVTRTLEAYNEIKFDHIILCGSIVPIPFPWSNYIAAERVTRVLNDYGRKDFWAKVAQWVVNDAGQSGAKGFSDDAEGQVVNLCRPHFHHSDFFYEANYERTWIPFLSGTDPNPGIASNLPARSTNWKFRSVQAALIILVLLIGWVVVMPLIRGFFFIPSSGSGKPSKSSDDRLSVEVQNPMITKELDGGGAINPMVVFHSKPAGATVSFARIFYAYDDPLLKSDEAKKHTFTLPEPTPVKCPMYQGRYQVVFQLNGKLIPRELLVTVPTELSVDFR